MTRLYHRTTAEATGEILRTGRFLSNCQDRHHAYFCDRPDGPRPEQYGRTIVEVEIDEADIILDDSFSNGAERFYRVPLSRIGLDNIVASYPAPICDHTSRCCTAHGVHVMPHRGCIMR